MISRLKRISIIIFSILCMAFVANSQPYQLRLGKMPVDTFMYRITESTDFTIKTDESTSKSNQSRVVGYKFRHSNHKKTTENKPTEITIEDILIKKKENGKEYYYDSKLSEVNFTLDKGYAELLEHQFEVTFDSLGKMTSPDDYNSVFGESFGTLDIFDETDYDLLKKQIQIEFNSNTFEQTMRYFQYTYPIETIHIGESWNILDTIYPNFGVLSNMTYTLKEIKNDIAYINIRADLVKDPNFRGIEMDLMHLKFNLQGHQEGLVLLDLKTGWIRKMSIAQEVYGKMTVFFVDPKGETFKIKLRGSTVYDLINYQ